MPLLRRPLRPNLRPLLLTDITTDEKSEPLSPLSSVSSSTSSSPSASRQGSRGRSPHHLPPLGEEHERSENVSLITPFQSERLTSVDRLTTAVNSLALAKIESVPEEKPSNLSRPTKKKRLLEPLKTREYSQFSALRQPVPPSQTKSLNKTPKFKGPPALPARRPRSYHDPKIDYASLTDDGSYIPINNFTFNDFLLDAARTRSHHYQDCTLERAILSRYTYKQICEMILERIWSERNESGKIHIQTLVPNIQPFQNRVPMHQIVTEMALLLRQHMSHILGSQLKMNIRALPSWRQKEGAHTEILLYETAGTRDEPTSDAKSVSKESNATLNMQRDTGAEIAILDSLIRNGTHLDLRAFTLEYLPDISLMFGTLVAVDLSYNCLRIVPRELFQCAKLEHLYLRHNPIASISSEMSHLKSLVFLDLAFCQLHGNLPNSLFGLINLRHLDVSYNCLTHIPSEISNLKNLRQFVCDGNEITYLPASMISMENLRLITAKNTWLLPQFAQDESSTKPQKLLELLAVRASKYPWRRFANKIPDSAKALLSDLHPCDSCAGVRVSNGFRTIITFQNLFGIKFLPILFISCTPHCLRKLLMNGSDRSFHPSTESIVLNDQIIARLKMRLM